MTLADLQRTVDDVNVSPVNSLEQNMDRKRLLKIKLKSLAAEAHIIRTEEQRTRGGPLRNEMAEHRRGVVRSEARHTHLAYGFLRGRAYHNVEPGCGREPQWARVEAMVRRYGDPAIAKHWDAWLVQAKTFFVHDEAVAA